MILKLRRRHRRVMLTLAVALPTTFAVAILCRRPVVLSDPVPISQVSAASQPTTAIQP